MEVNFGLETDNKSTITLEPVSKGSKTRKLLKLSNKAANDLSLDQKEDMYVAFSFSPTNMEEVYLVNANSIETKDKLKISKNLSIRNAKYFDALKKRFNVATDKKLEFELETTSFKAGGQPLFKLSKIND